MKDRVRESLFNLLGFGVKCSVALDLFAGTGAVAIEAISRGAKAAVTVERNFPMTAIIRENARALGIADCVEIHAGDTFIWLEQIRVASKPLPKVLRDAETWTVFFCPPYSLYVDRKDEMLKLIQDCLEMAPAGSHVIVEADQHFDYSELPDPDAWDVRNYAIANLGLYKKPTGQGHASGSA